MKHHQIYKTLGITQKLCSKFCEDAKKYGIEVNSLGKSIFVTFPEKHSKKQVKKELEDVEMDDSLVSTPKKPSSQEVATSPSTVDVKRVSISPLPAEKTPLETNKRFGKKSRFSDKFYERGEKILEILKEKSIMSYLDIRRKVKIDDSKSRDRIINYLVEEKKLKAMVLNYRAIGGHGEVKCVANVDFDESNENPIVIEFLTELRESELKKGVNNTIKVSEGMDIVHLSDVVPLKSSRTNLAPKGFLLSPHTCRKDRICFIEIWILEYEINESSKISQIVMGVIFNM
jgi:DNA-binding Lrp family transcriptional regulator